MTQFSEALITIIGHSLTVRKKMAVNEIRTWPGYREVPERLNITAETLDKQIISGNGERIAFKDGQRSITNAELNGRVCALAS